MNIKMWLVRLLFFEGILAGSAKRTGPIIRQRIKRGAGRNAAIRVALGRVIDILADCADPTFHVLLLFCFGVVVPADALNRASVNSLLYLLFGRADRCIRLRFAGAVKTEHVRTGGNTKAATDTVILIYNRFFTQS